MDRINIYGPSGPYDVLVGDGVLTRLGDLTHGLGGRAAVVADENVAPRYGAAALSALSEGGMPAQLIVLPPGEQKKTHETLLQLYAGLADMHLQPSDLVIGLGGGVLCDMVAYASATYLMGVRYLLAPTTLVAMVDACIGSEATINVNGAPIVGLLTQPALVVADTSLLRSLPEREMNSGLSELLKLAAIRAGGLWASMDDCAGRTDLFARLPGWVAAGCRIKAEIVQDDPRETGQKMLLQFGHTFGRAVETAAGGRLLHGEAVAVGMVMAARWGERLGVTVYGTTQQLSSTLVKFGLPVALPDFISREAVLDAFFTGMSANSSRVILLRQIGVTRVRVLDRNELRNLIESVWAAEQ